MTKYLKLVIFLNILGLIVISCGSSSPHLPEDLIWNGYAIVINPSSEDYPIPDPQVINAARNQYRIEQRPAHEHTVPNPRFASNPPVQPQLLATGKPVTGIGYFIFLDPRTKDKPIIELIFVRWNGTNEWWVSKVGPHPWKRLKE